MDQEKDTLLVKTFPKFYADRFKSPQESCMSFGVDTGNGWFTIVWEMSEKLEKIINTIQITCAFCTEEQANCTCKEFEPYWPRAAQIKEKFGILRVYMTSQTKEMDEIIAEAENKSSKTCELCGDSGKRRGGGWVVTECDKCYNAKHQT